MGTISANSDALLSMHEITKSFPGVLALSNISLKLDRGEVLALLGENGAGKSTLIKILGGAHLPDKGDITINGTSVNINNPVQARENGIAVIYQEFNLIPDLTVIENIFLGKEKSHFGFVDSKQEYRDAEKLFARIGISIDPGALCSELSVAQQQIVEIAKALSEKAQIIVMDEPSAALTGREVKKLFEIIRDLKMQGIGIIYISHRLEEIYEVADRVVVLRDGNYIGSSDTSQIERAKLIEMMVGRSLEAEFPERTAQIGGEILEVENLSGGIVKNVSFSVREGEVLGFAGLVGAGRTETMRLLFGADKYDSGRILIKNRLADITSPTDALGEGICLLTEDRKSQGLILEHSARDNFGLPNLDKYKKGLFIDEGKEQEEFGSFINKLKIKITGQEQLAMNLSGGNQQKIVLAKWLAGNSDIIIFDEPTRGIDVGAKYEIYLLINELAAQGKAVIIVSSELPEILGMSDRIIVMHDGRIKGEIKEVSKASQEDILSMAIN